jgi:hypothetical protein
MTFVNGFDASDWVKNRNSYRYIPGKLISVNRFSGVFDWDGVSLKSSLPESNLSTSWGGSIELDDYHKILLSSKFEWECITGFLSVIFWGYISGRDGVVREARSLGKVRSFINGRKGQIPTSKNKLLEIFFAARESVFSKDYGKALYELMTIKYIGMSFASKLIMFIDPNHAAIYDSVISRILGGDKNLNNLYVETVGYSKKDKLKQSEVYDRWCNYCWDTSMILNKNSYKWMDWDGRVYPFRAVDVERSFFAQAAY